MTDKEIKLTHAESYDYVKKNIGRVNILPCSMADLKMTTGRLPGVVIGLCRYEDAFYSAIFDLNTFTIHVEVVTEFNGSQIEETDEIMQDELFDLIQAAFDNANIFYRVSIMKVIIERIIKMYVESEPLSQEDKEQTERQAIAYSALREAIQLATDDYISVDDLKCIIQGSKSPKDKLSDLLALIQSRKKVI